MRNLFLTMSNQKNYSMSIITHRGSREQIDPGMSKKIPIGEDDALTNEELINFYDIRYKKLGLETKILNDGAEEPVKKDAIEEFIKEDAKVSVSDVKTEIDAPENDTDEVATSAIDVDSMSMDELRKYVKDHDIKVAGNSKKNYIEAIKATI